MYMNIDHKMWVELKDILHWRLVTHLHIEIRMFLCINVYDNILSNIDLDLKEEYMK